MAGYGVTIFYRVIDGGEVWDTMQYWRDIEIWYHCGDDKHGILAFYNGEPTPGKLSDCFRGTHKSRWGEILKGAKATGIYGKIIRGIKRFGFREYMAIHNDNVLFSGTKYYKFVELKKRDTAEKKAFSLERRKLRLENLKEAESRA